MDLKERVKSFMSDTGAKLSVFCRKVQMSSTYYYAWMRNEVELSENMNERIKAYLDEVSAKQSVVIYNRSISKLISENQRKSVNQRNNQKFTLKQ